MSNLITCTGQVFSTPYESGCVVTELPESNGNFMALDSDGVECLFNLVMVSSVADSTD